MKAVEFVNIKAAISHNAELIVLGDVSLMDGKVVKHGILLVNFATDEQARLASAAISFSSDAEEAAQELAHRVGKKGVLQ